MAITPYLFYQDVMAAQRFLAKAFGFKKYGATKKAADGTVLHAAMKLGDAVVMMGFPGPKYRNPRKLGQATLCLYVEVDDVAKHYARSKKASARIIEEPQPASYGPLRYGAEDPEGHQWYFAHPHKP